jgi:hypothetical protein
MSQRCDVIMSEGGDAMPPCNRVLMRVGVLRLFESQTRMLVAAQMTIVSMLLGHPMGMRRTVMEFGGSLVVLVVRSVVVARRHI